MPALLEEVAAFWAEHGLGEVVVGMEEPLTMQVDSPRAADGTRGGRTPGGFAEAIIQAILEERLGVRGTLENGPPSGQKEPAFRLVLDAQPS